MRILLADRDPEDYARLLLAALPQAELVVAGEGVVPSQAEGCTVWLGQPDLLADLPRDYRLSRAVGIFGQVMAEYVLTYLLAHRRRLLGRLASQVAQHWDGQLPSSLRDVRVLVVGAGDIGTQMAEFLAPFGVQLRGIARQPRPIAPFAEVHGLDALGEQAAWADCLINLLPDTPATHDIYDAALFAQMPADALFINIGRGVAVVDEDLLAALRRGQLGGAVIDVCRQEPLPAGHGFWDAPRLLLTGHSSAPTDPQVMTRLFLDNLQRWQHGEPLRGEVDFARGY